MTDMFDSSGSDSSSGFSNSDPSSDVGSAAPPSWSQSAPSSADYPFPPPGQPAAYTYQPGAAYPPGQYPSAPFPPGQYPSAPFPPGQQGYHPYFYAPALPRNNPLAITALVCGLVQFVLGLLVVLNILAAIPAIVFGSIALRQIRLRGERGRGMAIAGLVLGILGVVYFALIIVLIIVGNTSSSGTS